MAETLDLFCCLGRLSRFERQDGKALLNLVHWKEHQKVDKPSISKLTEGIEPSRKLSIPLEVRRELAKKYGCAIGGTKDITCYYCGEPGTIHWWTLFSGKPSMWVTFTLEVDHFVSEDSGGKGVVENLVLACRRCNRKKSTKSPTEFANIREDSRGLATEQGTGNREHVPPKPPVSASGRKPASVEEVIIKGQFIGVSEQDCRDWFRDCEACAWTRGDGTPFDNWPRQLVIHRDKLAERKSKNGNNQKSSGKHFDRNAGTANEGRASQYNLQEIEKRRALRAAQQVQVAAPGATPNVPSS